MPWISAQLVAGSVVRFARYADLPPEAAADLTTLRALGVRAAIVVPLTVSGAVVGALSYATVREERDWPDALVPRVQLLGDVFASVLARQEAERREQEAQAQAAHAARVGTMGVFAASLVHELTQPLAASLANAETASDLLAARSPDLDELRATVADIVADDRRASELIQQLRRFLRRGEVERGELDLREVVDEVLRLIGSEAGAKGIALAVEIPRTLPKIVGDRVQLQQALLNLLLNGIDAMRASEPGSRRLGVVARPSESGVCVEVTDSGSGMDEQTLARIFQPFFTTKPQAWGSGSPSAGRSWRRTAARCRCSPSRVAEPPSASSSPCVLRTTSGRSLLDGLGRSRRHRLRDRRRPVDAPGARASAPGGRATGWRRMRRRRPFSSRCRRLASRAS